MDFVTTDDFTTSDCDYIVTRYDDSHSIYTRANFIDISLMFSVFLGALLALVVSNLLFGGGTK